MPSRFWSCSDPTRFEEVLLGAMPAEQVWGKPYAFAHDSTSRKTAWKTLSIPVKSSNKTFIHQSLHSFLQARTRHRLRAKNMKSTRRPGLCPSRFWRREDDRRTLFWVEQHVEITEKHQRMVETGPDTYGQAQGLCGERNDHNQVTENWFTGNQLCHTEGQRWRINGHTIEPDIYPMCPKGEQL